MNRALFALPLIALAAVPTFVANLDALSDLRFLEQSVARDNARAHARAVSARVDERLAALRNTLLLVRADEPAALASRGEACGDALARSAAGLQGVGPITILDRTGRVQCSSEPALAGRIARGDNSLRAVLRGKTEWAVTSGVPTRPGEAAEFALAAPLRDDAGNVVGAIAATTSATSLLAGVGGDAGAMTFLLQESGEVLGQSIGAIGDRTAEQTLAELRTFFIGRLATEVEALGRMPKTRRTPSLPSAGNAHGLTIAVGVPAGAGGAGAVTAPSGIAPLITGAIATLLACAFAWTFGAASGRRAALPGNDGPSGATGITTATTASPVTSTVSPDTPPAAIPPLQPAQTVIGEPPPAAIAEPASFGVQERPAIHPPAGSGFNPS